MVSEERVLQLQLGSSEFSSIAMQCDQEIIQDLFVSVSYPGSQIHRVTAEWF